MLDNEPTGGPTAGETQAAEPTDTTTGAQKSTRRRSTRRRGDIADTAATSTDTTKTAATTARPSTGDPVTSAGEAAVTAQPANGDEPAVAPRKRASRARKKAAPAGAAAPDPSGPPAGVAGSAEPGTPAARAAETGGGAGPDGAAATGGTPDGGTPDGGIPDGGAAKKPTKRAARSRKKAAPVATGDGVTSTDAEVAAVAASAGTTTEQARDSAPPAPAMAAPPPPVVMFMAPDATAGVAAVTPAADGDGTAPAPSKRSRSRRKATAEPAAEPAPADATDARPADEAGEDTDDEAAGRSRRRRGRRGRGRGRGGDEQVDGEETADDAAVEEAPAAAEDTEPEDDEEEAGEAGTRRRRRRRRRGSGAGDADHTPDDPPNTVVRVREPRAAEQRAIEDEVQGVKGSTRLEAKRQRRRDGRDQGRRRPPVLSEAEFLARREAVERVMVVRQQGERTQIAVLEDDVLVEHYVTKASSSSYAGNVYLGKVQNVLPSMEAAFVDIGKGRNAVLYAGEVNWDASGLEGKPRKIEQALKSGDAVLAQVTKDPIGHKGARLTSQISLPGRFLVYVPEGQMTGISRKLSDTERKRLKDILKKIVPENAGVIIRTAAEGATEDELSRDVARLEAQWQSIRTKSEKGGAPALLHAEPDLVIRVIRDIFNEDFGKLVVQGNEAWETVEQYVAHVSPDLVDRLSRHTGESDVFHDLRIDEQLMKALDRKVWLPSGGSLVIDRTEAMTVVDVNTGKYTGQGGNLEETVTRNNLEAAEEIVRQLRLRDIGGIIVIDFIDMVLESNRDLVLRRLTECLGRDRTKHQVAEVTSLGLVQMTRKRVGQGLLESFSEICEHCRGRGIIIRTDLMNDRPKPAQAGASATEPKSRKRRAGRDKTEVESIEPVTATAAAVAAAIANGDGPGADVVDVEFEPHALSAELTGSAAGAAAVNGMAPAQQAGDAVSGSAASGEAASGEAVSGDVVSGDGQEPGHQAGRDAVASVPAPRKRTRRAASRPAGPPTTEG